MPNRVSFSAVVLSGITLVLFTGCKQDVILHDAAAFKDYASQADGLVADIAAQPQARCERIEQLGILSHSVSHASFATPVPTATPSIAALKVDCSKVADIDAAVKARLDVVTAYLKALVRAGTGQSPNLKPGEVLTALKTAKDIKTAPDAGDVDKVANAAIQLFVNHERALFVRQAVLIVNDDLQKLAGSLADYYGSSNCASGQVTYCAEFASELDQISSTYGNLYDLAHTVPAPPCAQRVPCATPTPRPPSGPADVVADATLLQRFTDARGLVQQKVRDGKKLASLLRSVMAAHQDLHDFILRAPDTNTAIFDR